MKNSATNTAARELPSNDHLRLLLGEMTAQEMRTAKAAYQLAVNTLTQQQGGEHALAETQRAIIEAAERRGYQRGLADAAAMPIEGGEQEAGEFDRWHAGRVMPPRETDPYHWRVEYEARKRDDRAVWEAALRTKQPAASEGDGIRVERAEYFSPTEGGHFLRVVYRWPHNGKLLRHTQFVELHSKDQVEHLIVLLNTSKQAAGEAVALSDSEEAAYLAKRGFYDGPSTLSADIAALTTPPRHPADEGVARDAERLDFLLSRMKEVDLNRILGGYRMIFTVACARSAIDHAMTKVSKPAALQAGTP